MHAEKQQQASSASMSSSRTHLSRHEILENLYHKLRLADDNEYAEKIEREIEDVWRDSGSPTIDLLMSRTLIAQQKHEYHTCLKLLDEVTQLAPDYIAGWNRRALIHFEKDDFIKAMMDIRKVLSIDPHNYQAINGLGLILREVGKKRAALKVFKRLLDIHPHYNGARQAVEQLKRELNGQDT